MDFLKTEIQNELKRSKKYGVGKEINNCIYIHKNYKNVFDNIVEISIDNCLFVLLNKYPEFIFDIIKYDQTNSTFTFVKVDNFNLVDEPKIIKSYKVDSYFNIKEVNYSEPVIYHNKWLMVKDDYKGFDVESAKNRTIIWKKILNEKLKLNERKNEYLRIGKFKYWNDNYIPYLNRYHKENYLNRNSIKTSIYNKTPSRPLQNILKNDLINVNTRLIDYGCGKMRDVNYLKKKDFKHVDFSELEFKQINYIDYHVILCTYVLCTVTFNERIKILQDIKSLMNKYSRLYISVRTIYDIDLSNNNWVSFEDGYITNKNTFQKGYTITLLDDLLITNGLNITKTIENNNHYILLEVMLK